MQPTDPNPNVPATDPETGDQVQPDDLQTPPRDTTQRETVVEPGDEGEAD